MTTAAAVAVEIPGAVTQVTAHVGDRASRDQAPARVRRLNGWLATAAKVLALIDEV